MNLKIFKIFTFISFILTACTTEKLPDVNQVYEIREIGLLSTTEYTIGKVIKLKDDKEWYKYGDRNILISCKAKIKAGIDLSEISPDDIQVQGNSIKILLPTPKILALDMDPNFIKTEMEDISGFRKPFTQEEKNKILILGESSIREKLPQTTLLKTAEKNAHTFVQDFYKEMGFKEIEITFKKGNEQEIKSR